MLGVLSRGAGCSAVHQLTTASYHWTRLSVSTLPVPDANGGITGGFCKSQNGTAAAAVGVVSETTADVVVVVAVLLSRARITGVFRVDVAAVLAPLPPPPQRPSVDGVALWRRVLIKSLYRQQLPYTAAGAHTDSSWTTGGGGGRALDRKAEGALHTSFRSSTSAG